MQFFGTLILFLLSVSLLLMGFLMDRWQSKLFVIGGGLIAGIVCSSVVDMITHTS